jgi:hypothetical protein
MVLSRLKLSSIQIKNALLTIDFEIISNDRQEMLLNTAPNSDELEIFTLNPPEDTSLIAPPDLYFYDIC